MDNRKNYNCDPDEESDKNIHKKCKKLERKYVNKIKKLRLKAV